MNRIIIYALVLFLISGCDKCNGKKKVMAKWAIAIDDVVYHTGNEIEAQLRYLEDEVKIDSVVYTFNGTGIGTYTDLKQVVKIPTESLPVGSYAIKAIIYYDGKTEVHSAHIKLFSNIKPKETRAVAGTVYPHSIANFTEGFFVHDGMFYESTGLNGKSFVYRYRPGSKDLEKLVTLDSLYFGEGIVRFDNKVYQLTWQGGNGFVYDATTWKIIKEFHYGSEGWGLTHNGQYLIMSDGTNRLFFLDPNTLSLVKIQEVCDDLGKVSPLNELEYIDGFIYANIWQTDQIVKIDSRNGKVVEQINCEGMLSESEITNDTHEMNGIAYDESTKKIYITGKNWPKIFELKIKN